VNKLLSYNPKKITGPKALMEYFFNKVNYKESLIIILISFVINCLFYVIIAAPNLTFVFVYEFFKSVVFSWFVLGILIYLVAYFILGKKNIHKRGFEKTLSALAAFKIPLIIYSFFTMAVLLIFMPNVLTYFITIFQNPLLIASNSVLPAFGFSNLIGALLLLLVGLGILVYMIIMYFYFAKNLFKTKNFGITFLFLILLMVVTVVLNLIISI
jgi:hypothetical protein